MIHDAEKEADDALALLWATATKMDRSLRATPRQLSKLRRKRVSAQHYSRRKMFQHMANREVAIFTGVPIAVRRGQNTSKVGALVSAFLTKFPRGEKSRVQVGPSHVESRLPVREIMRRWVEGRRIVGVTDLHIRGTGVERVIATDALSDFNLLIKGSEEVALEEMMTLVIASRGNVTDSHSDDPDGTNHCFIGKKLWLAWDVFEGMKAGLQDVERQYVRSKARFNMKTFLSLRTSVWFVISEGQTLFLPGNMTHKVLTLEPYLGVGSFNVTLPNAFDNLARWIHHKPLWALSDTKQQDDHLVEEIARICLRTANRAQSATRKQRDRWGIASLRAAFRHWTRTANKSVQRSAMRDLRFAKLAQIAQSQG